MRKYLFILSLIFAPQVFAQTGIGTTTPDASAKLEIAASNKGFLPPRVALTATNAASPITNPANGLMVFNTVTAGSSPYQVVPGYYYWDGVGLKWVSLSTTVGNVQNQAIYRSTGNTTALNPISTWSSSFNNIASGDLSVSSSTSFTLSNGIYKLEWALPYQPSGTYNDMLLQEYISGSWSTFRGNDIYARIANGGSGNWGGTTFAADVVDCTSSSKIFRLYNADGSSRTLFAGATFIITKLNPSITTSTTADNLGNHIATANINLNGNYLSNDGGNKGIKIDNSGNVGVGVSPAYRFHILGSDATTVYIESTTSDNNGMMILNANTNLNWSTGWHEFIRFMNQGTIIGQINQTNASTINYATTSDYRLKTDFQSFKGLDLVNKIKTYNYAWKSDSSRMYGVRAHELQEILPYLVSGKKDEVDKEGKIVPQTVDYGKLTPILVKAIQEQDSTIKLQKNKINSLIKKNEQLEKNMMDIQHRLLNLETIKNK